MERTIEVLDIVTNGSYTYYCVVTGVLKIVNFGKNPYKDAEIAATIIPRADSFTYDRIWDAYHEYYVPLKGYAPCKKPKNVLRRLYKLAEGKTVDEAIDILKNNIRLFKSAVQESSVLYPDLGIITKCSKPIIRRYTENKNKATFDIVEVELYTVQMSKEDKRNFYIQHRKELAAYISDRLKDYQTFNKYGVSPGCLELDHGVVTNTGYFLSFVIRKELQDINL